MNHIKLDLDKVTSWPRLFADYINQNPELEPFYSNFPTLEGFEKQIKTKSFSYRNTLVTALKEQYIGIENPPRLDLLLNENTFTVTTGHQLNIFTGPLYVIYKIVSTINLADLLKNKFPDYEFIPIYWMATEDHDFTEISTFSLFNKTYEWKGMEKGAVGKMDPKALAELGSDIKDMPRFFYEIYEKSESLTEAVRRYMHFLFGHKGLICVDGDDKALKRLFYPIIKRDIFNNAFEPEIKKTSQNLNNIGYKTQIHPRPINFFWLERGLRERIEKSDNIFKVLHTNIVFSEQELMHELEGNPEKFSPNVNLRPLFQETILPNLAYLGGPSEISYWLQLKGAFLKAEIPFPILLPRNFALIVNTANQKKIDKLGLVLPDLFLTEQAIKDHIIERESNKILDLSPDMQLIHQAFSNIKNIAESIDPTLSPSLEAEKKKTLQNLDSFLKRLKKSEEKKYENQVHQVLNIKQKLFPDGGLQERSDNFLNFYINDPTFLEKLFEAFDPLNFRFNIIKV